MLERSVRLVQLARLCLGFGLWLGLRLCLRSLRLLPSPYRLCSLVSRSRDLLIYSVRPEYFAARERLGVNIDAG